MGNIKSNPCASQPSLSQRAQASVRRPAYPPHGNTGGISRHRIEDIGEIAHSSSVKSDIVAADVPQNTPPSTGRRTRARQTSADIQQFLELWFFDWLTVTIPNPDTGKGSRQKGVSGDQLEAEGSKTLTCWAVSQGLHCIGMGNGSDGFDAGAKIALSPVDNTTVGRIRSGHKTNMPGLELSGADGACDALARSALDLLGPVLVARVDVSLDWSRAGLWDDLLAYAYAETGKGAGKGMKEPDVRTSQTGRTFYWGSKSVGVKVYEKDKERAAKGKIAPENVDPDLVRIEFTFRPETRRKAAFAKLSPGEMIGTSRWARRFVVELAKMVEYAGHGSDMAETRVDQMPDASTVHDRAAHVIKQAAKTCIKAAADLIRIEDHGGDWSKTVIDPDRLHHRAIRMISEQIADMGTATSFVLDAGLDRLRTQEERAEAMAFMLSDWINDRRKDKELARDRLTAAVVQAGLGMPSSSDGMPDASASSSDGVPF